MTRVPRAPEAPLPELAEFLAPFTVHFAQRPSARVLERYCTGLLTEHPNKNCDTLARLVPGTSEQRLQGLLTTMAWDEDDLNRHRVRVMAALATEGDGVLVFVIAMLPDRERQRKFNKELGITYPVFFGSGSDLGRRYAYG